MQIAPCDNEDAEFQNFYFCDGAKKYEIHENLATRKFPVYGRHINVIFIFM